MRSFLKILEEVGVELTTANTLPLGQRTQRKVAIMVTAMRSTHELQQAHIVKVEQTAREQAQHIVALTNRLAAIEGNLRHLKVTQYGFENELAAEDRTRLLEAVS